MLSNSHSPKGLKEIIGQDETVATVTKWINGWKPGSALLIFGPTGIGKTSIVHSIAKDNDWDLIEINASDERSSEMIISNLSPTSKQKSLFKKSKIILIDEIDCMYADDKGGVPALIEVIRNSAFPVILTANDAYDRKIRELRSVCQLVQMKRLNVASVEKKLQIILMKEGRQLDPSAVRDIAKRSGGDMRAALNDLEIKLLSDVDTDHRERTRNVFDVLKTIFTSASFSESMKALDESDKDLDEIILWLQTNVITEYKKPEELAEAMNILSMIDVYKRRISDGQNYKLLKQIRYLICSLSAIRTKPTNSFNAYRPPDRWAMYNNQDEPLMERFANELHCSKRLAKEQLPYLKIITMGM